jgi:hypothetical protein
MDDAKQQLIDKLKNANNILVTVSRDPSVDQLASCIGLTLLLNKQGKHAAAVFSGKVPSTLEFLEPDETLEKNTDSLRDFIISLDKAKADKLRYKVEEDVVRIFITPYRTSLSADDLEFSEGDFNVDVVVALGVKQQEDLDQAITAHGRILHDATVTSINIAADGGVGTINWYDPQASSLSELVTDLAQALNADLLDSQIATSLLTGIVSETGRFSNERTSSQTMSASAALLSAGANQQLVASNLDKKPSDSQASDDSSGGQDGVDPGDDGTLSIDHNAAEEPEAPAPLSDDLLPKPDSAAPEVPEPQPSPPPEPPSPEPPQEPGQPASTLTPGAKFVTEPPKMGGTLTANSEAEHLDPVTDPMSLPATDHPQLLGRKEPDAPAPPPSSQPAPPSVPPEPSPSPPPASAEPAAPSQQPPPGPGGNDNVTLSDLERSVDSPHLASADLDSVRSEVDKALSGTDQRGPIEALNAQPLGDDLHPSQPSSPPAPAAPADDQDGQKKDDNDAPPPVPPPIPFQFGNSPPPS